MRHPITLLLLTLSALFVAGCGGRVVTSGDYTLESGKTLSGNLTVFSGDVELEEDSRVTGDVFMTSGDLDANGEIDGDIFLTSGNVDLGDEAVVRGDVLATSGNVRRAEGANVEGEVITDPARLPLGGRAITGIIGSFCIVPLAFLAILIVLIVTVASRRSEPVAQAPSSSMDPQRTLKQLQEMIERGLITEADYESKKAEVLSRM